MSFEWLSWLVWSSLSLCGCLWAALNIQIVLIAFGSAALVVLSLYETGLIAERWHENK